MIVALTIAGVVSGVLPLASAGTPGSQVAEAASPLRVNAGSWSGYTDSSGQKWWGDYGYQGGRIVVRSAANVSNTTDPALYANERDGMTGYRFAVPNGTYQVLLHFAETSPAITGPKQRVFGLAVNGVLQADVDVFASAGGANRAMTRAITARVTNGAVDVQFVKKQGETLIDALEVIPSQIVLPTPVPVPPTAVPVPPTAIPVPPTAIPVPPTSTAVPPTATAVPPMATAVPPTATAVPTAAPPADCSKTLQSLIDAAPSGSVLYAPNCIYSETITINKPLTLDGTSGANLRGSDVFSAWTAGSATWVSQVSVPAFDVQNGQGFCADGSNACNWPEQVFLDGRPLTQVAVGTAPAVSQFSLDGARHVILADNPAGHTIEVSTRTTWVNTQADNVTIQNFTFWHAANAAQTGAIGNQNHNNWTLQDSKLYYAHGGIVSLGGAANPNTQTRVLRNAIAGSSYEGINGYMNTNTLIQGNSIFSNNLGHFDVNWSGGGVKVVAFTNVIIDNNDVYGNLGPGLWCDIGCNNATYSNNRVHDNTGIQVFYEISSIAKIYNNSIWNGQGDLPGIFIASSNNVEAYNNTVARTARGIMVYDQNRSDKPAIGTINDSVHDNKIVSLSNPWLSVVWTDDGQGVIITPNSNNHGTNNSYYYPGPEDANPRFQWGSASQFAALASFITTPGGAGSSYMTAAQSSQALTNAGIPAS